MTAPDIFLITTIHDDHVDVNTIDAIKKQEPVYSAADCGINGWSEVNAFQTPVEAGNKHIQVLLCNGYRGK
jgi:L-ascorbate metabolism protein UlaG (beta-lactamase superfamily)